MQVTRLRNVAVAAAVGATALAVSHPAGAVSWQLMRVSASAVPDSSTDAWGLGTVGGASAAHWNGRSWTMSALPKTVNGATATESGISGDGPADAWVVGSRLAPGYHRHQPIVLHFDGTSWSTFAPADDGTNEALHCVVAFSPTNVWAAGGALLQHWDGTAWSRLAPPAPAGGTQVTIRSLTSAGSALWGIGQAAVNGQWVSYLARFDGSGWTMTAPMPTAPTGHSWVFGGLAPTSAGDAWVSVTDNDQNYDSTVLTLHWTGSAWRQVAIPAPGEESALRGIAARSPSDAWAVGTYENSFQDNAYRAVAYHWDGTAWSRVSSFPISTAYSAANLVAYVPGTATVWIDGTDSTGSFITMSS